MLASKLEGVKIKGIRKSEHNYDMDITLPYNVSIEDFKKHLPGIEQTTASIVQFKQLHGRLCQIRFGYAPFSSVMNYVDDAPMMPLVVPLYSPFGKVNLDFNDESSCHLLNGGATRMGKTAFLRYLATHLIRSVSGNIKIVFIDNKVTDLLMFRNIPQVDIAETEVEAWSALELVKQEIEVRKELLKKARDCVDIRAYRKKYPDANIPPFFVIYDEFARHCHNDAIQDALMLLTETAGYLDIHIILATQRPDAKDVVKPRIKANMLARICFTTANEANSKIILDSPDAAYLGAIQGRAILMDGIPQIVQVPYVTPEQAVAVLQPYYRKDDENDYEKGRDDYPAIEALPSDVAGPDCSDGVPGDGPSSDHNQPDTETTEPGWLHPSGSAAEGSSVPLYAESSDYSPAVGTLTALPRPRRHVSKPRKAKSV